MHDLNESCFLIKFLNVANPILGSEFLYCQQPPLIYFGNVDLSR